MRGFQRKNVRIIQVRQLIVIVTVRLGHKFSPYVKKIINTKYFLNDDVHTVAILEWYLHVEQQIKICHELTRMESCRGEIPLSSLVFKPYFFLFKNQNVGLDPYNNIYIYIYIYMSLQFVNQNENIYSFILNVCFYKAK
jgi:hypothetical protein